MKVILVRNHGGPEVLNYKDVEIRQPGPGEILARNRAVGVNYTDVYMRTGSLDLESTILPFIPGKEGAGEV
ncbi:alcohol dehydrogenase catalytic domain-containing protein [Paenibacillus polymyxa]|uniref:alcohol dehydrogenase catalytic domain-containing protein n=1 Tax=Paenibacillus polymyxa TaxID=1406 RepID=UPI0021E3B63A|nr:alcohol dehydrogenase catalytic domain-containing protein [Paenibacillus polymyxa]